MMAGQTISLLILVLGAVYPGCFLYVWSSLFYFGAFFPDYTETSCFIDFPYFFYCSLSLLFCDYFGECFMFSVRQSIVGKTCAQ